MTRVAFLVFLVSIFLRPVSAEVVRVEIESAAKLPADLAGQPYEDIRGKIFFAFDPANRYNARIVDLELAPTAADGRVEAWANFRVLRPRGRRPGEALFLEVSNRGGQASLRYFNNAERSRPFGDGFLMEQGFTIVWVGWQFDVPEGEDRLRLHVPAVSRNTEPVYGLVRSDWTVDRTAETLLLGHRNHIPYPVADPGQADNVLTVRDSRDGPRRVVARDRWSFTGDSLEAVRLDGGFEAGKIYEAVYRAREPKVVGLGLAVIRDVASYAKYASQSEFPVRRTLAFGVSQTGRFLRHFLYQGFNTDEEGRKVLDGLLIHTAGAGRGSFNHRFAQPSRDAHRYSAFFYPTDLFPFSGRTQFDPETGRRDGLVAHSFNPAHLPKIFYTNTGYEYWGRAASLLHTSVDGSTDVEPLPNERIYHLAGGQHFVGRFPPPPDSAMQAGGAYRGNPLNFLPTLRALIVALDHWVKEERQPPASRYPRIDEGTLVPINRVNFPEIPGLRTPETIHIAYRADYGPRWGEGIVDKQPPDLGKPFPSLVAQLDEFGNEVAGVRSVELRSPLATYFPWNLREGYPGGEHELTDFLGTFVPLPRTESARRRAGDSRPSIRSRYGNKNRFLQQARIAAVELVREGFLLRSDVTLVVQHAEATWGWIQR